MCRLYIFQANEPTKVECPLVYAQNALMMQSIKDTTAGMSHAHGWGIATYKGILGSDGVPRAKRQAWAAYHGEHFEKAAAGIYSTTVLAHVRRATVGEPALKNTHPFVHDHWAFAHNGTVPGFQMFKEQMVEETAEIYRPHIAGETDSEHVFYFFLTYCLRYPDRPILENLRAAIQQIYQWSGEYAPKGKMGLNLLFTDGRHLYGSRIGRTLFYTRHEGVYDCEICGFPHIHHAPSIDYRAIDIASEPITRTDNWTTIPEQSLFHVDESFILHREAL